MKYNPFTLEGKTILVTGASSGIGRAVSIECSKLGAKVILTARNEDRLKETISMMEGDVHNYFLCDLSNSNNIESLVKQLPEIQGVVNNAGCTKTVPIPFISEDVFSELIKVDTLAPILLVKELVKKKKLRKDSSIVFTSSIAGMVRTSIGNSMYAACKGAISAFVRASAKELATKGIRVNAVCPAMVDTGIMSSGTITEEQLREDILNYPLKRYGKPEDVAWAMIFLLSDASSWITGTNMIVDGGISVK